jgi:hypothetical protein
MAYRMTYWADDNGRGQFALKEYRLKSVQEIPSLILDHQRPEGTVLVTVGRTDGQSPIEKIVWQKSGYKDPCEMVRQGTPGGFVDPGSGN